MDPHAVRVVMRLFLGGLAVCVFWMAGLYFSGVAVAQGVECGPRDDVLSQLKTKYHEEVTWFGLVDGQTMEMLTMSPKGTWSRIRASSTGAACILSSGQAGQFDATAFDAAKKAESF